MTANRAEENYIGSIKGICMGAHAFYFGII